MNQKKEYRILHLEDTESDSDLVKHQLTKAQLNFTYFLAKDKASFLLGLEEFKPNVVLCDHSLPQFDSIQAFELYHQSKIAAPFILVTGSVSEEYAVAMIKSGIDDYLLKSNLQRLAQAIENGILKKENELKIQESTNRLQQNEKKFRALIEKSTDMKALTSADGKLLYCSPSISKTLGYSFKELSVTGIVGLIHPDDAEDILKKTIELLERPGDSFFSRQRLKHKNGHYIWCEGTITNHLHDSAIEALVSNFRDITERKKSEQQREFNRKNLLALINNTQDLIWSVNTNFKLITSNIHFEKKITEFTGNSIKKGKDILSIGFTIEQNERWKGYYTRAFAGETFSVIERTPYPHETCSEISFYPIYNNDQIIGTACFSHDIKTKLEAEEKLKKQYFALKEIAFMLSHQARAPIASVLGLISLFNTENINDPINIEVLNNIQKTTSLFDNAIHQIVKSTNEINKL